MSQSVEERLRQVESAIASAVPVESDDVITAIRDDIEALRRRVEALEEAV